MADTNPPVSPTPQNEPVKVDFRLLYTGILLFVLAGAAYFIKPEIFQNGSGFFFVKVFLSLGSALIATQIPGMIGLDLGIGIKAAGALGVIVLIFLFTPQLGSSTTGGQSSSDNNKNCIKIRLAILSS